MWGLPRSHGAQCLERETDILSVGQVMGRSEHRGREAEKMPFKLAWECQGGMGWR